MTEENVKQPRIAGLFSRIASGFKKIRPSNYIQLALMVILFVPIVCTTFEIATVVSVLGYLTR